MDYEVSNVRGEVSPEMIEIAVAAIAACQERGFRLESFVVKPLEGGESKS